MLCPACGSHHRVTVESRPIRNGTARRRRFICNDCAHRFTGFFDAMTGQQIPEPPRTPQPPRPPRPKFKKLTEALVVEILERTDLVDAKMAEAVGVTRQCVTMIRTGKTHSLVRPDLPRRAVQQRLTSGEILDIIEQAGEGMPLADIAFDYELPEWRVKQIVWRGSRAAV